MTKHRIMSFFYVLVLHLAVISQAYPSGVPAHAPASQQDKTTSPSAALSNENSPLIAPDTGGGPHQNVHKRNLVAASKNIREALATNDIGLEEGDSGDANKNVHKRNLVGLHNKLREETVTNDVDQNDGISVGEGKLNVRKRNLVGISAQARDVSSFATVNAIPDADTEESNKNIHKRNLVGLAAKSRESIADAQTEPGNLLDPASLDVKSDKDSQNIRRKKNLVALEKKKREGIGALYVGSNDDEPSKTNKRRNIVGEANAKRNALNLGENKNIHIESISDAVDSQSNVRKRNIVGMAERRRTNEQQSRPEGTSNSDAQQTHQNDVHKRNLVGKATKSRDSPQVVSKVDRDDDDDDEESMKNDDKRQVNERLANPGQGAPASNSQEGVLDLTLESGSGDPKRDIRRGASKLMALGKSSKQSTAPETESELVENEADSKLSKARSSSMDFYPMGHTDDERLLQRLNDFSAAASQDEGQDSQPAGDSGSSSGEPSQPAVPSGNGGEISNTQAGPIKEEEPLPLPNTGEAFQNEKHEDHGFALAQEDTRKALAQPTDPTKDQHFTLFTIANTDVGVDYEKIPYRERYLWDKRDAPCHSFSLKVPDETEERSTTTLCIYRPNLEFPDETRMFIHNSPTENSVPENKVFGYVMNTVVSAVYGRIVDRYFYGEVSIYSESTNITTIYVVEQINLLNRLMRNNQKTLKHMLMVMHGKGKEKGQTVYNSVVTKGASLIDFMVFTNPTDINRNSFIMLSTDHNSYICPGEPTMKVEENGHLELESGSNKITVEDDGSVHMLTKDKAYTFRPHGRTIITEGRNVKTLQEHEGSVAITAFTSTSSYDCVLPSPAFQPKRRGGYVCKVCIAVDDLFTKHFIDRYNNDKESSTNYIGRIIDRVSWIFRSIDFDDDKRPDNIGLDYDAQSLRWTYPNNNNEDLTEPDIEVLFQSLASYDFSECCLAIGYTMKNFPENENARRPMQTEKTNFHLSGVCGGKIGRIPSNLIIISANDKRGKFSAITEKQLTYLTANQIAASFGALADGAGADVCDQFTDDHKVTRHYLMWPDVLRNTTLKEQTLSSCSKQDIVKTLSTCKSSCFDVDRHPFCGNGIVEEGEECDCGTEYNCKLQSCCYSRIGKHPCRKSGIGCKANSAPASAFLENGLLFATLGLLAFTRTSFGTAV